ncbi:unnamed protein product [Miscanthus lutarioriparius]|uniref:Uncharacterized protein n=1 Tax=Miscanthus lutarioriparius TaxID=422564 RepID=A0A811QSV1_9POAL|nr:unnamed protein product [Miscanthus lutarioriparius]
MSGPTPDGFHIGLVENICSGSLNPRKGSYGWWEGDGLGKHGPCCTEQEEWGKNGRSQALITTLHQKPTKRRKEPSHKDSWSNSDGCSCTGPYIVNVRLSRCSDGQYGSMHTCPKVDAMLTVTSDSRKASLGSRLVGRRQLSADASVFLLDQGCLLVVTGGMVRDRVWSGVLWRAGGSRV